MSDWIRDPQEKSCFRERGLSCPFRVKVGVRGGERTQVYPSAAL